MHSLFLIAPYLVGVQSAGPLLAVGPHTSCALHAGEEYTSGCTTIDEQKIYALPDNGTYEWLVFAS